MNRTLLTLTGLLLAAPLAAQQPSVNEMKASELLQQSAQKAMAGYEDEATKLAAMAMELLAKDAATVKGEVRFVLEESDNMPKGQVIIVEGTDGREIIEFIGSEDIVVESEDIAIGSVDRQLAYEWSLQAPERIEQLAELGYIVEMEDVRGPVGDSDHDVFWMTDGDVHQNVPMPNGDLHQQLREIQHELESLRHELRALRSDMNGGRRGGMQSNRRSMGFPGGEWNGNNNLPLRSGTRFQMRMAPGQVQRLDLHQLEGLPRNMKLHETHEMPEMMELHKIHEMELNEMHDLQGRLEGLKLHEMHLGEGEDFDFDFNLPEGAEVHEEVVVIINGEKFTGDAAREKLKELNLNMKGEAEGKVHMRMVGKRGAFPAPPMPPKPPQQNRWRSKEQGHDHEEL